MKKEEINIAFLGDVRPGGILDATRFCSEEMLAELKTFDIRIATFGMCNRKDLDFEWRRWKEKIAYIIFSSNDL